MRALIVPSWYPSGADDLHGSFFGEQVEILRAAGQEIEVLAPALTPPGTTLRAPGPDGVHRVRAWDLPKLPELSARVLGGRARRLLAREPSLCAPFDVIHAHSFWPGGRIAAQIAAARGTPLVVTEHRPSTLPRFRGRPRRRIGSVLEQADVLSTVSSPFSRAMEEAWGLEPGSVDVLPNPLDLRFLQTPPPHRRRPREHRFLHVSHPSAVKRVDDIVAAFGRLPEELGARLVITGGDQQTARRRAAEYGGSVVSVRSVTEVPVPMDGSRILVTPAAARDEMVGLLDACDSFVLASEVESFGVVLAEAMSRGLTLVTTDTWGGRSIAPAAEGLIVPVGDVRALSAAMTALMHRTESTADRRARHDLARELFGARAYVDAVHALWERARGHRQNSPRAGHRQDDPREEGGPR